MVLTISRRQRQQLLDWAASTDPDECCGILFGTDGVVESLELTANVALHPAREFEIDPSALIVAEKRVRNGGPAILGYFHSHPNGKAEPSLTDASMAAVDSRCWLIIADAQITCWWPIAQPGGAHASFVRETLDQG